MGYRFQFISLAGYYTLNLSMYQFAKDYVHSGMTAYSQIQQLELEMAEQLGHTRVKRQESAGAGYFNAVNAAITHEHMPGRNPHKPTDASPLEVDTLDYNDGEATERTPMPHLYPSLESMPLPSTAAND